MGKPKKLQKALNTLKKVAKAAKAVEGVANAPMKHLGGAAGARLGSRRIGEKVGSFLGSIVGSGPYSATVRSNSILKFSGGIRSVPRFRRGDNSIRVANSEYLGDIIASSDGSFSLSSYPLNPGMQQTFPWLSTIAANFEEWEPHGLVFFFESTSSTYSGTASLGQVSMAVDYDPTDPPYASSVELLNSAWAVGSSAAEHCACAVECEVKQRAGRSYKVRTQATSQDLKWFDHGNFQYATNGCAANQICGRLWVTYDIKLMKPQYYGGLRGLTILAAQYTLTGADNTHWLGTSRTLSANATLESLTVTSSTIVFPRSLIGGTFIVGVYYAGTSATISQISMTPSNGLVTVSSKDATKTGFLSTGNAVFSDGTSTKYICMLTVYVDNPTTAGTQPTLTFSGGTIPTSLTTAILSVTQAPYGGF